MDVVAFRDVLVAMVLVAVTLTTSYLVYLYSQTERVLVLPFLALVASLALLRVRNGTRFDGNWSMASRVSSEVFLYCVVVPVGSAIVSVVILPLVLGSFAAVGSLQIPGVSHHATGIVAAWTRAMLTQWMIPVVLLYGALAGGAGLGVGALLQRIAPRARAADR